MISLTTGQCLIFTALFTSLGLFNGYILGKFSERGAWNDLIKRGILPKPKSHKRIVCWFKHGPYDDGEPLSVVFEDPKDDNCYSALTFAE